MLFELNAERQKIIIIYVGANSKTEMYYIPWVKAYYLLGKQKIG